MRALPALACLAFFFSVSFARAAMAGDEIAVGADQRTALQLTVYEQNLALVADRRTVNLDEGLNRVAFLAVSAELDPDSVVLDEAAGEPLHLVEQRYVKDLLTPNALLAASVGHDVRIAIRDPRTGEDHIEPATVLSAAGGIVLKLGDRIETGLPGRLVYAAIPPGLRDKPTLVLTLRGAKRGTLPLELSYLTAGLGWSANYVAELDPGDKKLALSGRASVTNTSGVSYPKASLTLVAGTLHRVARFAQPGVTMRAMPALAAGAAAPAPLPRAEGLSEYYRFAIPRAIDLGDHETVQLALLEAPAVPVAKEYRIEDEPQVMYMAGGEPTPLKVLVRLSFENSKSAGLGTPLPQGTVRVYRRGEDGALAFLGEDDIDATAAGRPVRLTLGEAFDVSAERRQTAAQRPNDKSYDASEEITLRNAKKESVAVTILETLPGDWRILEESAPHEKASSSTASWRLEIPAGGERKLTYRVLTRS